MPCVFCNRTEAHICSLCVQKILLMPVDKLRDAAVLAEQKGFTEKAEILNSYLEEVTDEGDNDLARGAVGGRRVRGVRNEKESARQAQKHKRSSLRQAVQHKPGVPFSRLGGMVDAEP